MGAVAVARGRLAEPAAEAAKTRSRSQREQLRGEKGGVQKSGVVLELVPCSKLKINEGTRLDRRKKIKS